MSDQDLYVLHKFRTKFEFFCVTIFVLEVK